MVKIKDFEEFEIHYDPSTKRFEAKKGYEVVAERSTQEELENHLKKLHKRSFKRIKAIALDNKVGELTSAKTTHSSYRGEGAEGWFVYVGKDSFGVEKKTRTKVDLRGSVYEATPKNLELCARIVKLKEQLVEMYSKIQELKEQYEKPITRKNVFKLAGIESEEG